VERRRHAAVRDPATASARHAEHGSNYTAMDYTERIVELGTRRRERWAIRSFTRWPRRSRTSTRPSWSVNRPVADRRAGEARDPRADVVVEQPAPSRQARHAYPGSRSRTRTTLDSNQLYRTRRRLPLGTKLRPVRQSLRRLRHVHGHWPGLSPRL